MTSPDLEITGLIKAAEWLDGLIQYGALIACTVIVIRLLGKDEFEVKGVKLKVKHYLTLAILLTILHGFYAILFVDACNIAAELPQTDQQEAWKNLTIAGPMLFRGMEPRTEAVDIPFPFVGKQPVYVIENSDWAGWLSLVLAGTIALSTLDIRHSSWKAKLMGACPGILLAITNWGIGSWWAIQASRLA